MISGGEGDVVTYYRHFDKLKVGQLGLRVCISKFQPNRSASLRQAQVHDIEPTSEVFKSTLRLPME